MGVLSISVCHVVSKLAIVNVAFSVPKSSLTLSFVIAPLALVMGSIVPILNTIAMSYNIWHAVIRRRFSLAVLSIDLIFVASGAHLLIIFRGKPIF